MAVRKINSGLYVMETDRGLLKIRARKFKDKFKLSCKCVRYERLEWCEHCDEVFDLSPSIFYKKKVADMQSIEFFGNKQREIKELLVSLGY